ncbi:Succinylglutamate desuccinylase [bacterium HR40]|nr:Succinylglutamate desuccinylase [bacterium HR40]
MSAAFPLPRLPEWCWSGELPGVLELAAARPGPHVAIFALVHGNEPAGAAALLQLCELGIRPARGRLTLCFANPQAYAAYDPSRPAQARFLDEDLNRLWDDNLLDRPAASRERARARQLRSLVRQVDFLLDLHSMQVPGEPLLLCHPTAKAVAFALRLGIPATVVSDPGHESGRRLIDYSAFADPERPGIALLLEAGCHRQRRTVETALAAVLRFLDVCGILDPADAARFAPRPWGREPRLVRVEERVTVRRGPFRLVEPAASLRIVPRAGTTIAFDGGRAVRTPFDDCVLLLPAPSAPPGHTALRLGRLARPVAALTRPGAEPGSASAARR